MGFTELPGRAGVGLKADHVEVVLRERPEVGWFEVHAENYMGAGGPALAWLERTRADYPLSIHSVGLSIGAAEPLDRDNLGRLRTLLDRYQPEAFSEHLAWSSHGGVFFNDLLPIPYNAESLARVAEHIEQVQEALGRRMLLENPATYLAFETSTMSEIELLGALVKRTGCGLLLDVNNAYVSGTNQGFAPLDYLRAFPLAHVGEIHLAGHDQDRDAEGRTLLIDTHDRPVAPAVWDLYADTIHRAGPLPTLIEWDGKVPPWPVLFQEAETADRVMARYGQEGDRYARAG
jgi:uncharacterized protein (UPF0276 family)